jgi:hypothetical protein
MVDLLIDLIIGQVNIPLFILNKKKIRGIVYAKINIHISIK